MSDDSDPRSFVVTPSTAVAVGGVPPVGITMSTLLWVSWAEIAVDHAIAAQQSRRVGADAHASGDQATKEEFLFGREVKQAMVSTTSAAFALDGLDGVLRPLVDPVLVQTWIDGQKSAHDQIRLALEACYRCRGSLPREMVTEFRWLFSLVRNGGVHHRPTHQPPVLHPVSGVGSVSAERALYLAEQAERAVEFMLKVIELAANRRLAKTQEVAAAADEVAVFSHQLRQRWDR